MGSAHNQNANHSANKNISVPFAFRSSFQFSLPAAGCKLPAAAAVAVASCLLQAAPTGGRYSNYFQATLITHKSLAGSGQPIDTPAAPAASMGQSEREREGKRWHRERERGGIGESRKAACFVSVTSLPMGFLCRQVLPSLLPSLLLLLSWPVATRCCFAAAACSMRAASFTQHAKHLCDIYSLGNRCCGNARSPHTESPGESSHPIPTASNSKLPPCPMKLFL